MHKNQSPAKNNCEYHNSFIIRGNVVGKSFSKGVFAFKLKVTGVTNVSDYPWVVVYDDELGKEMDKNITAGERVTLRGYIHTSKSHPAGVAVVTGYTKELSFMDVAFENSKTSEDEALKCVATDVNSVTIKGTLLHDPYSPNQTTIITVKSKSNNGSPVFISMACFGTFARLAKQKKKGDEVQAVCYIKTSNKPEDKKNAHTYVVQALK